MYSFFNDEIKGLEREKKSKIKFILWGVDILGIIYAVDLLRDYCQIGYLIGAVFISLALLLL